MAVTIKLRRGLKADLPTLAPGEPAVCTDTEELAIGTSSGYFTLKKEINQGAPASASATGTAGQVLWDDNWIYICVDTDTWVRAALNSW